MQSVFWGLRCRVEQDAPQFYPSSTQELVVNLMSGAECNSSSPSEIEITGVRPGWDQMTVRMESLQQLKDRKRAQKQSVRLHMHKLGLEESV